ncbi:hypothetical protein C8Q77DRAFT_1051344 [Trametes polyzona]|nr:hypothetical protein C8Q77DRAFT_1051344 [Trametes polyzona]
MEAHEIVHNPPYVSTNSNAPRRSRTGASDGPPIPGMWGFLTSGYFVGLFIMAFVLNRIQNIVVPPRRPPGFRIHNNRFVLREHQFSWHQLVLGRFFPVDLSSISSRLLLRVPSLYLLGKAVVLWTMLLLQAQQVTPQAALLEPLASWATSKKMEDVCWYTFLSACIALCIGTLTTGLEGLNMNDTSPFNLFAFAFQLYVCSAAHSYPSKGAETPSRPDVHVIITILLPLLQLIIMHCLEVKHRWTQYRLALSGALGLLALIHFHYVVWRSPPSYPLTTFAARAVESVMLAIITFTVGLNVLTQLLLTGAVSRPLFGHAAILPRGDEDFNVALFRLGTASMDATAVAGLGNEVGGVASAHPAPRAVGVPRPDVVRGELELDRTGVAGLTSAYEQKGASRVVRKGFANEIASVKARGAKTDVWMNTVLNVAWQRQFGAFLVSAWKAACRVAALCMALARGRSAATVPEHPPTEAEPSVPRSPSARRRADTDVYERFLRGEPVSDDDEDDFQPDDERRERSVTPATPSTLSEDEDGGDATEQEEDDTSEQARLFADLSTSASQAASAPLLLAHMTDTSPSPLTRRGYRRLVSGGRRPDGEELDEWDEFLLERRRVKRSAAEARGDDPFAEQTRNCVICTVEPRDIICWPCRCLALCDDCRENLASRSSASKHTCPCCRRSVEGYSKIYIP